MLPLSNYNASTHTNYLTELLKSVPVSFRGQKPVRQKSFSAEFA